MGSSGSGFRFAVGDVGCSVGRVKCAWPLKMVTGTVTGTEQLADALHWVDVALTAVEADDWDSVAVADREIRNALQSFGELLKPKPATPAPSSDGDRMPLSDLDQDKMAAAEKGAAGAAEREQFSAAEREQFSTAEQVRWLEQLATLREGHQRLCVMADKRRQEVVLARREFERARMGIQAYADSDGRS